ncbi:ABC transporter permease [Oribacterium sp. WCC10]|uniref:ABC transporter permease n=1 Tax=Oribacterium sp. WCC10 TaxID=1855343 RepID=UPI0008E7F65F|nr:FtsX-like permease family protein [Oribacterium sp. WCC10]SFG53147.1 putative ABC transport system permease protein [Oribacterium sp. WCC10]
MTKNLVIKLIRDLRENFVQFLAIFLMCFFAMFIMEAFDAVVTGLGNSVDEYYKETNFMDIKISSEGFSREDLSLIMNLPAVKNAELRYTTNGKVKHKGKEKKLEFNFIEENEVSKMLIWKGTPYEKDQSGIWIDRYFAEKQGIDVGDELQLICDGVEFDESVRGIVENPDHSYFVIDNTYTIPSIGDYGYAFLDSGDYPGEYVQFDSIYIDLKNVSNQFELTEADKKETDSVKLEIQNLFSEINISCVSKKDEEGHDALHGDMESDETLEIVFPCLFITIALLGIVSTMTRLVLKQRTIIGTFKALGFAKGVVFMHYITYSVVVCLLGCILGAVAGWFSLGQYILDIMAEYYCNPYQRLEVSPRIIIVILAVVGMSALTNFLSCRGILSLRASEILVPEPPTVAGAGIIEKAFFWNKLSFASRWNIRDINRNKIRTLAGIIGVTLCTALMLTAFGMDELNKGVVEWQYSGLTPSNYQIGFAPETDYGTVYEYSRQYKGQMVEKLQTDITKDDKRGLYYVTVMDEGNLYRFQDDSGKYIRLPDMGVAASARVMEEMDLKIGDTVSFRIPGVKEKFKVKIYTVYKEPYEQGIAMKRRFYESINGEFKPNQLFTNMTVPARYATEREEIISVFSKDEYIRSYRLKSQATNLEVYYVMTIAVLLGIVVMYNLGVLSFAEKMREVATLKVLGFSTGSIRWILNQQSLIIDGAGTVTGLILGKKLLVFAMSNLDYSADYIYRISYMPYLLSVLISFVLSIVVNSIISAKVKTINMVDALKGVR